MCPFPVAIHEIAAAICPRKCATLLPSQALTECDTMYSFAGIGKTTLWPTRNVYTEVTEACEELVHSRS